MDAHWIERFERAMSTEIERLPSEVRAVAGEFCSRGKRVRPMLVGAFASSQGATCDAWIGLGAAVELLHKASLIQDDLPIMDDDATRGGWPTVHESFSPAHALLASDAMIGHAFRLGSASARPGEAVRLMSDALSDLCSGQLKDLHMTDADAGAGWDEIVDEKTGALFVLAARLGALAAGRTDEHAHTLAQRFGRALGRLYQLLDDVADGDVAPPSAAALGAYREEMSGVVRATDHPAALQRYVDDLSAMGERLLGAPEHRRMRTPPAS